MMDFILNAGNGRFGFFCQCILQITKGLILTLKNFNVPRRIKLTYWQIHNLGRNEWETLRKLRHKYLTDIPKRKQIQNLQIFNRLG